MRLLQGMIKEAILLSMIVGGMIALVFVCWGIR